MTACSHPPLRVALWAPVPPPPGGVGSWTLRYQRAAAAHHLQVHTVNIAPTMLDFSEASRFRLDRVQVAGRALAQLAGLVARRQVDVAHLTTTGFWAHSRDALALAVCKAAGVPTVLHIHASTQIVAWHLAMRPSVRAAYEASLRLASVVLVLSTELRDHLRRTVPGLPVQVGWNMVEPAELDPPPIATTVPLFAPRTRQRVLFVGAMTPKKGLTELAQAVLALPDVELACVGGTGAALDPAQGIAMEAALAELDAAGRLLRTGSIAPELVRHAYRQADLFCLPSHLEGLPTVLLEAMAAGLPCVVTPVGGVPDLAVAVGGTSGGVHLVPVADPNALQAALAAALSDPQALQRQGQLAQAWVRTHVTTTAVMAQYWRLYRDLVGT